MSILDADFMRLAFAAGAVIGVVAPVVGFFLVQRRMSLIGDGIGHLAFAGVALGYLLDISPVGTALVVSTLGAVGIEWLRARRRAAGDQALALVFYTGIAAGVVFVSAAGALNANLFTFLFGPFSPSRTRTWPCSALSERQRWRRSPSSTAASWRRRSTRTRPACRGSRSRS